jgi:chemotaxis protein MotB
VHMESLRRELESALMASPEGQRLRTHVRIELTPQGLRIQVVDDLGKPMFERGSARPDPAFAALLRVFGGVLGATGRKVVLLGHTDGAPYAGGEAGYTNWELSIDRANAARRELLAGGMDAGRVQRVVGMAAAMPLDAGDPLDPANRRISILVLDRLAEERMRRAAGEIEAGDAGRMESALEGAGSPQGSNSQSTR